MRSKLSLNDQKDLAAHESEILGRLREEWNGQALFLLDPLRALDDVGVELSAPLAAQLREKHGWPTVRSPLYELVREGRADPPFTVHIEHLIEGVK